MSTRPRSRFVLPCALACGLLTLRAAMAADPPGATLSPQEAILRAMERPLSLDIKEKPLIDAAAMLENLLGVPVRLDEKTLNEVGILADTPVTWRASGIPAGSALDRVLADLDLTWTVRDEALTITTPEEEAEQAEARVYDVADLVYAPRPGELGDNECAELAEVIEEFVRAPGLHSRAGQHAARGVSGPRLRALVVSQSPRGHLAVQQALAVLRAMRADPKAARARPSFRVPPYTAAEEAILAAIERPAPVEFIETPIQDVAKFFRDELKVPVRLDQRALDDVGLGTDMPVTICSKGVSARASLELILRQQDLTWLIRDDALLVTTPKEAEDREELRFYEVSDLVLPPDHPPGADPRGQADFDSLASLIQNAIAPTSWEGSGPGEIRPLQVPGLNLLVFDQTPNIHEQVDRLLAALRQVRRAGNPPKLPPSILCTRRPEAEKAIEAALRKPVTLEFIETPLQDVLDYLTDLLNIPIHLDRKALDGARFGADTPVTKNLKGISARSALRLMLRELDLTYVIDDEVLRITTPEAAEWRIDVRVYPVADLVRTTGPDGKPRVVSDPLVDMIHAILRPTCWDTRGGHGRVEFCGGFGLDVLVVAQTREVHAEIEDSLALLRSVRTRIAAGKAPVASMPLGSPQEEKIKAALGTPVKVKWNNTMLADVIDDLAGQLQVEIQVDKKALDDVGIGTVARITHDLKGITARSALRLLLRELDLTCVIQDEVLLITTPEEAESRTAVRVYPVGDLVRTPGPDGKPRVDFEPLIDLICAMVPPSGWDGGEVGAICGFEGPGLDVLAISQTQDVHEHVEEVLAGLRRLRAASATGKPQSVRVPPYLPEEEALAVAMAKSVTLDFVNTPLEKVAAVLGEKLGGNVVLDRKALDNADIRADMPVTFAAKDVCARAALDRMLAQLDLDWMIDSGALLITYREETECRLTVVLYDVTDLPGLCQGGSETDQGPAARGGFDRWFRTPKATDGPGSLAAFEAPGFRAVAALQTRQAQEEIAGLLVALRKLRDDNKHGDQPLSLRVPPCLPDEERTLAALSKPVKLNFIETPLEQVAAGLAEKLGVEVEIDAEALADAHIRTNTEVTFQVAGISARAALDHLLGECDLTWVMRKGRVVVTTPKAAVEREVRVHDVRDLCPAAAKNGKPEARFDWLIDLIVKTIEPLGWDVESGLASIAPYEAPGSAALIASGTPYAQEHVAFLLAELRRARRESAEGKLASTTVLPGEAKIRKALARRDRLVFDQTPLEDVRALLADLLDIPILFDRKGMHDIGLGTDAPVTFRGPRVSIGAGLGMLLRDLELTWVVKDEVLLVTTPEKAESLLVTRVYDVSDLASPAGKPAAEGDLDRFVRAVFRSGPEEVAQERGFAPIGVRLGPTCLVVVRGTRPVHEEVEQVLAGLRKAAK